ncbi:MAG TPA: SDR family NAD(P)-dependent oxidoreductase [Azospirillaceae bacterium]|nr:SDR family NAD(P)-dependent oxidoreductase [Azospirillaceae bacterium]
MTYPYAMALITGASGGLGGAFARALPDGCGLLLTGRSEAELLALQSDLKRPGRIVEIEPADLSKSADRRRLIERAEALRIDLLVNNAANGRFGLFLDNDAQAEVAAVEVNCVAPVDLTRALLPGMLSRAETDLRRCGLLNVSSTTAFQPIPRFATYAATKSFLLAWTEALAEELRGRPVDVLALCPGAVRTGFGSRAEVDLEALPGVRDADPVAREALAALGRRTVYVSDPAARVAVSPFLGTRRVVTAGAALVTGFLSTRGREGGWVHRREHARDRH